MSVLYCRTEIRSSVRWTAANSGSSSSPSWRSKYSLHFELQIPDRIQVNLDNHSTSAIGLPGRTNSDKVFFCAICLPIPDHIFHLVYCHVTYILSLKKQQAGDMKQCLLVFNA